MNLIASVSVLAILVGLACGQSVNCPIEINVDYLYNDITYSYVTSAGACQDLCNANPACQTWSYVVVTNVCWLKSVSKANRVDSPGRVSGGKCTATGASTTTSGPVTPPTTTTAAVTAPSTTTAAVTAPTTTTANATATTTTTTTKAANATTTLAANATTTTAVTTTAANATATTTTSSSKKCFLEVGLAYKIGTLGSASGKSKDECCSLCIAKTGCQAWTFYSDASMCVFLDYKPLYASQREANTIAISGIVQ